jgi:thioredoxin-like negative regulator of GroEL
MPLRSKTPLPELSGATRWINGDGPGDLDGRPVLVHFWSITCYICHEVAEQVAGWRERFGPQGLAVVSIHQPRGPEELDIDKVIADAQGPMGITQPMAIDNTHTIVDRFQNQFVPGYYIFDKNHLLRHFQAGDKGYDKIEAALERVVSESPQEMATAELSQA